MELHHVIIGLWYVDENVIIYIIQCCTPHGDQTFFNLFNFLMSAIFKTLHRFACPLNYPPIGIQLHACSPDSGD